VGLLDRTIVFSFDRTGYQRHARAFEVEPERALSGRRVLITGGTDGIGLAAAKALGARGAALDLWARDPDKGERAATATGGTFVPCDLGDLEQVADRSRAVDGDLAAVVLNAGAMPMERTLTAQGHELVWGSQVLGHLTILRILRQRGLLQPSTRVVWVSSGGMYLAPLDLDDLRRDDGYQRHAVYANAKRAQVQLMQHLARAWPDVPSMAMHPGWVETDAVRTSMPLFHLLTRAILRTPAQGADTIVWLVTREEPVPTGRFWFDRREAPVHVRRSTRVSAARQARLVERVFADTDPWVAP
jgi:NAD(P)-dependent dehydrogenase (short-subunit alcohol dehydrogenase family)